MYFSLLFFFSLVFLVFSINPIASAIILLMLHCLYSHFTVLRRSSSPQNQLALDLDFQIYI